MKNIYKVSLISSSSCISNKLGVLEYIGLSWTGEGFVTNLLSEKVSQNTKEGLITFNSQLFNIKLFNIASYSRKYFEQKPSL